MDYFYDGQIRNWVKQFHRVVSGWHIQTGYDKNGDPQHRQVPARYAQTDFVVGTIMRNNSYNTAIAVPCITYYIKDLVFNRDRTVGPSYHDTKTVYERGYDREDQEYTDQPGQGYTVQRAAPVPVDLVISVDMWTTKIDHKLQLIEQLYLHFNHGFDLQSNRNALDYGSYAISVVDNAIFSNRSIPIGNNYEIDSSSFDVTLPIWISPPAKVQPLNVIHQVNIDISLLTSGEFDKQRSRLPDFPSDETFFDQDQLMSRQIVTPGDHQVEVYQNEITLLGSTGLAADSEGNTYDWHELLKKFGIFQNNITEFRLLNDPYTTDLDSSIKGTIYYSSLNPNKLFWNVDITTLPANTLDSINAIIDPTKTFPGNGLPIPTISTRYIVSDIIAPCVAWGELSATPNDIIQWNGTSWTVVWAAIDNESNAEYILNMYNNFQLVWTGEVWQPLLNGKYKPGFWRILI